MILTRRTFVRAVPVLSMAASTSAFAGAPDFLSAPTVSMDALRSYVMDAVRPNPEVENLFPLGTDSFAVRTKDGREHRFGLNEAVADLSANPTRRVVMLENVIRKINETIVTPSVTRSAVATTGKFMVVLRHRRAVDTLNERMRAQSRGASSPAFIQRTFLPDVIGLVVLDLRNVQKYVTVTDPLLNGMGAERVYEMAMRNTEDFFVQTALSSANGLYLVDVDPDYNSSVLLYTRFWASRENELGGPLLVIAPDRETVIFGRETVEKRQALNNMLALPIQSQPVCDRLMRYSQGRWSYATYAYRSAKKRFCPLVSRHALC